MEFKLNRVLKTTDKGSLQNEYGEVKIFKSRFEAKYRYKVQNIFVGFTFISCLFKTVGQINIVKKSTVKYNKNN